MNAITLLVKEGADIHCKDDVSSVHQLENALHSHEITQTMTRIFTIKVWRMPLRRPQLKLTTRCF